MIRCGVWHCLQVVQGLELLLVIWDEQDYLLSCRVAATSVKSVLGCLDSTGNPDGENGGRFVELAERIWKGRNSLLRMYKGAPLDQLNVQVQYVEYASECSRHQ